jgi:hypothetical protein
MSTARIFLFLFVTFSLISCTTPKGSKPKNLVKTNTPPLKTIVFAAESCLLTGSPNGRNIGEKGIGSAVAATVLPLVIEYGISKLVKKLNEVETKTSKGAIYADLYKATKDDKSLSIDPSLNCITAVTARVDTDLSRGDFIRDRFNLFNELSETRSGSKKAPVDEILTRINSAFKLKDDMAITQDEFYSVYEFALRPESDHSAFRIQNRYLYVHKMLTKKSKAGLAYVTEITGPGVSEEKPTYVTMTKNFKIVNAPHEVKQGKFKPGLSGLYQTPGMSKSSMSKYVQDYVNDNINSSKGYTPVKIQVSNIQTVKPKKIESFVASLLEDGKDSIVKSISEAILPPDTSAQVLDAQIAYQTAIAAHTTAITSEAKELACLQAKKAYIDLESYDETVAIFDACKSIIEK